VEQAKNGGVGTECRAVGCGAETEQRVRITEIGLPLTLHSHALLEKALPTWLNCCELNNSTWRVAVIILSLLTLLVLDYEYFLKYTTV